MVINGLYILFGFPLPIALAIMIFSMKDTVFKKVTQTISYLPHFVSWVVIAGIVYKLLDVNSGIVNILIKNMGGSACRFCACPATSGGSPRLLLSGRSWAGTPSSTWRAISYRSRAVRGGNGRWRQRFPSIGLYHPANIAPTIGLMLIFTMGTLVFEQQRHLI